MTRLPTDRFFSNGDQAKRTARHLSEFIQGNLVHLRKVDSSGKMEKASKGFHVLLANGEDLTPNQCAYLEACYEKCLLGAGYPAVEIHHDKRKPSMRFGR